MRAPPATPWACPRPLWAAGQHGGFVRGRPTRSPPPQDLCERHEKGVLHKHQRALHKYSLMRRQMSAAVHSQQPEAVQQLESRIVEVRPAGACPGASWMPGWAGGGAGPGREGGRCAAWAARGPGARGPLRVQQESTVQTTELRHAFSLYCLHQETQLVHACLPLTAHLLGAFVDSQIQGHKEVGSPHRPARPPLWLTLKNGLGELWGGPSTVQTDPLCGWSARCAVVPCGGGGAAGLQRAISHPLEGPGSQG